MLSPHPAPHAELFQTFLDRQLLKPIALRRSQNTCVDWEDAAQVAYEKLWRVTRQGKFCASSVDEYCHWATRVACRAIIDYVERRENRQQCHSLEQPLPGTDIPLVDTLVDDFDALDTLAQTDLLLDTIALITELDRRYPKYRYLQIWQGLIQGKTQAQIADALKTTAPEISKRWKRIRSHVAYTYPQLKEQQRQAQSRQAQLRQLPGWRGVHGVSPLENRRRFRGQW